MILEGGLHSAEALLWARYFMFTQLYFHPIRRVYDIHLKTFLKEWLPGGAFSTDLEKHLQMTDNEVMAALLFAARQPDLPGHVPARRLVNRDHFRILYERNPDDVKMNPEAAKAVFEEASCRYNGTNVYYDSYRETSRAIDFPVLTRDGRIVSCLALSDTLNRVPIVAVDFVFIAPDLRNDACVWLQKELPTIIAREKEESP